MSKRMLQDLVYSLSFIDTELRKLLMQWFITLYWYSTQVFWPYTVAIVLIARVKHTQETGVRNG